MAALIEWSIDRQFAVTKESRAIAGLGKREFEKNKNFSTIVENNHISNEK